MTAQPRWEDSGQGDLLELVAMGSPATGSADAEWTTFVIALSLSAHGPTDVIDPNELRERVRDHVAPRRVGAFVNRALSRGLIEPTGSWVVSSDVQGRNAGRPCREYRLVQGAS